MDRSVISSRDDLPDCRESLSLAKKMRFDFEEERRVQSDSRGEDSSGGPSNRQPIQRLEEPFPFGKLLYEAAVYRAEPGQKLGDYCFEKITKLYALKLEIPADYMIDAIIHGIGNEKIERLLRVRSFQSECELYATMNKMGTVPQGDFYPTARSPEQRAGESSNLSCEGWSVENDIDCSNCGKTGHVKVEQVVASATCLLCQKRAELYREGDIQVLKKVEQT